jgi:tetratricopeptide (TPR) repeat protein
VTLKVDKPVCAEHPQTIAARPVRCAVIVLLGATFPFCLSAQSGKSCDVQGVFGRADSLLKLRRYTETKAILKRLRGCANLSPIASFNLGWLYGRSHDFKTALEIFRSLGPEVPDEMTHQYAIALTEFELGDYSKSVEALKNLQGEGRLDSRSANLLGVSYSKLGLYQEAYTVLTENLRQSPSDLFSYLNLITLLTDAGHFADAADVANHAVAVFPRNSDVFVVRGAVYTRMGELDKAHGDFATAVHLSPRQASPRFLLALSEYKQADFESSSAGLRTAIQAGVVDSDLDYLLAECMLKTDPTNPIRAVTELNRAIALNSKSVAARTLRGKLLLEAGRVKEALADLTLAHRIDPTSRSAAYNLARAEFKLGRTEDAKSLFQQLQTQTGDSLSELSDQRLQKALAGEASH